MTLLTGLTEDGSEVPIQVKPDGRLVAEGLPGPAGLNGKDGKSQWGEVDSDIYYSAGRVLVGTSSATANGGILQLSSGITFPAAAVLAANPNTLDDYEEGSWTPQFWAGSSQITGFLSAASYIKIGSLVYVEAALVWGGGSGASNFPGSNTGAASIRGLPFTRRDIFVPGGFSQYGFSCFSGSIKIIGGSDAYLTGWSGATGSTDMANVFFFSQGSVNTSGWATAVATNAISTGNDVAICIALQYNTVQ